MKLNSLEHPEHQAKDPAKRDFFRNLFGLSLGVTVAATSVATAQELVTDPSERSLVKTQWGNFLFIPEIHDNKDYYLYTKRLKGARALFLETPRWLLEENSLQKSSPHAIMTIINNIYERKALIEVIQKNDGGIIFGDILFPTPVKEIFSFPDSDISRATRGTMLVGLGMILHALGMDDNSKRGFLKTIGRLAVIGPTLEVLTKIPIFVGRSIENIQPEIGEVIKRIGFRSFSLFTHFNPTDFETYLRDIFMTRQLLVSAEYFKKSSGPNLPYLGINIGGAHSGMEDLVRLGPEFVKRLILALPKDILKALADANGGVQNLTDRRFLIPYTKEEGVVFWLDRNKGGVIEDRELKEAIQDKIR